MIPWLAIVACLVTRAPKLVYRLRECRFHELGRKKRAARVAEGHMKNELARQQKRDEEKALLARIREQSKVCCRRLCSLSLLFCTVTYVEGYANNAAMTSQESGERVNSFC